MCTKAEQLIKEQQKKESIINLRNHEAFKLKDNSKYLPCPRGWFQKRCPLCNQKLIKRNWQHLNYSGILYTCNDQVICGYNYTSYGYSNYEL